MGQKKPPNTVSVGLFLPDELHRRITAMATPKAIPDYTTEVLQDAVDELWPKWLKAEQDKLTAIPKKGTKSSR